jgi:hypothetical protein
VGLVTVGALLGLPIALAAGVLGLYFLFSAAGAFMTGILSAMGYVHPGESPLTLILIAPAMAAIGAVALAGVAGYFWLAATMLRKSILKNP